MHEQKKRHVDRFRNRYTGTKMFRRKGGAELGGGEGGAYVMSAVCHFN